MSPYLVAIDGSQYFSSEKIHCPKILELCDRGYQHCRSKFSSRKKFWNILRGVIQIVLFRNFEHLLGNVADPPEILAPD